jgi:hypothetical protein
MTRNPKNKEILFIALTDIAEEERASILLNSVQKMENVQISSIDSFAKIPNAPLSYWLTEKCKELPTKHKPLESEGRLARQGLATADDFRYLRLWWEVSPSSILSATLLHKNANVCSFQQNCAQQTIVEKKWIPFAKGGEFSPYYADIHLVVNWGGNGEEIRNFKYENRDRLASRPQNIEQYFRPGLTWPLRTNGLSFRVMPAGCIFGHKGPALFADNCEILLSLLTLLNTRTVTGIVHGLGVGRVEIQSYEVGTIQNIPIPHLSKEMALLAEKAWLVGKESKPYTEINHAFVIPMQGHRVCTSLKEITEERQTRVSSFKTKLNALQAEAEILAINAYELCDNDLNSMKKLPGVSAAREKENDDGEGEGDVLTKKGISKTAADIFSWLIGLIYGRWDIRFATNEHQASELPGPFDPLPSCPPGMLQSSDNLPAKPTDLPVDYPIRINWDGILVDDPEHGEDIVRRVKEILKFIWEGTAEEIENEICDILDLRELRDYIRKPGNNYFWVSHIRRYSKRRRKAPIYWQLATPSASYSILLYYHRFSKNTLYNALNDYITPKLQHEEWKLTNLRQLAGANPTNSQRREITDQKVFVEELRAFHEEIARLAPLWNPDLDDGALINFAPLWRLVPQHRAWQNDCKRCWEKLVAGQYDWAHLARHLWPERILPKCAEDRNLAIAHGLEDVFWFEDEEGKWHPREADQTTMEKLIQDYTSPAVKEALRSLLNAPIPSGSRTPKRRKTPRQKTRPKPQKTTTKKDISNVRSVSRGADSINLQAIKDAIATTDGGASKADVLKITEITDHQWNAVIKSLLTQGVVVKSGERRGTRYHLAE